MILLLFGPPGCGKGTQSRFISKQWRIPAISTGEMLRAVCHDAPSLEGSTCSILAHGRLVADDIVNELVTQRVRQPDCRSGFLLDGYPRTLPQALFLSRFLEQQGLPGATVLHLDVPTSVLLTRISSRRQCPRCHQIYNLLYHAPKLEERCDADGEPLIRRKDDDEEIVTERLRAYEESTGPLIDFYRRVNYYRIDGTRSPDLISMEISALLSSAGNRRVRLWSEGPAADQGVRPT